MNSTIRRPRGAAFEVSLVPDGDCLRFTGAHTGSGYGNYWHPIEKKNTPAHVYAWEQINGSVPEGYELHHLCHVRDCIKVEHLQLVTRAEHRRIEGEETTHCPAGHEYDEANTRIMTYGNGRRGCKRCHADREAVARREGRR
jgi:hypothetical protein